MQDRGTNPFNFELLSTPLLLEKEASLRLTSVINNLDDADTYGDSNVIGSLCPTKKLAEPMASEGGDVGLSAALFQPGGLSPAVSNR